MNVQTSYFCKLLFCPLPSLLSSGFTSLTSISKILGKKESSAIQTYKKGGKMNIKK